MRKTLARLYPSDTNQPAPAYRGRHVRRCREHGMTARFLWCSICERNALRGDVYVPKHRAGLSRLGSDWTGLLMGVEIDVDALRMVAEGATPGPWEIYDDGESVGVCDSDVGDWIAGLGEGRAFNTSASKDGVYDAAFIAAANPETVLALLDRLQAAEGAVERVRSLVNWPVGRTTDGIDRMVPASDLIAAIDGSIP